MHIPDEVLGSCVEAVSSSGLALGVRGGDAWAVYAAARLQLGRAKAAQHGSCGMQQACGQTLKHLFIDTSPKDGLILIWHIQLGGKGVEGEGGGRGGARGEMERKMFRRVKPLRFILKDRKLQRIRIWEKKVLEKDNTKERKKKGERERDRERQETGGWGGS